MTTKTMAKIQGKALWYVGPGRAELQEEAIAAPEPGEVLVRALFGAISRGTERLVHAGRVPESQYDRMRAPFMGGTFPFPVKYGYATVGRVENGPAELQRLTVFTLHPHQTVFTLAADARFALPDAAPPECDLVFHTSATAAGLASALRLAGEEATIAELSWYGSGDVAAPLGEAFHSRRLKLISSQVGQVAPSHRPHWTL